MEVSVEFDGCVPGDAGTSKHTWMNASQVKQPEDVFCTLNILLLGSSKVGKTALCRRVCLGKRVGDHGRSHPKKTVDVDVWKFYYETPDEAGLGRRVIRVRLVDPQGQQQNSHLNGTFFRKLHGAIHVFSFLECLSLGRTLSEGRQVALNNGVAMYGTVMDTAVATHADKVQGLSQEASSENPLPQDLETDICSACEASKVHHVFCTSNCWPSCQATREFLMRFCDRLLHLDALGHFQGDVWQDRSVFEMCPQMETAEASSKCC